MKIYWAVILTSATMLSAVGLVSTGGWLISSAALMPPILVLQVAIVGVRFFGIARGVFRWAERVVSHDVALAGTTQLRVQLWNAAANLGPFGVWRLRSSDALDRLTSDTDLLQDEITRVRVPNQAALLSATLLVLLEFLLLPIAGVIFALAFLVSGYFVPKLVSKIEKEIANKAIGIRNEINSDVYQSIQNAAQLRLLDLTGNLSKKLMKKEQKRIQIESKASFWTGITSLINGISSGVVVFISLTAAVVAFQQGGLSGQMIAVVTLLPWASAEIVATFSLAATAKSRTELARKRINSFLSAENPTKIFNTQTLNNPTTLTLNGVSLEWDKNPVISDLSFSVSRGEILCLLGPSGSGKSTIINAILRLIPYSGKIEIDDIPIQNITNFQKHVSAMLQTTYIFQTSLRENLKIANNAARDSELIEVLAKVGLGEWFHGLKEGLDTLLGDGNRPISGGETQRIGIARTILSGATFIILDEPTEHLDTETANDIWMLIRDIFRDKAVIVVSHDQKITGKIEKKVFLV